MRVPGLAPPFIHCVPLALVLSASGPRVSYLLDEGPLAVLRASASFSLREPS